jgi:hypothetical protein
MERRRFTREFKLEGGDRGFSLRAPIAIVSGNDIEHALLGLAVIYVGILYRSRRPIRSCRTTSGSCAPSPACSRPGWSLPMTARHSRRAIDAALNFSSRGPSVRSSPSRSNGAKHSL